MPFWAMLLIALAYALAGFPAAMAYGAWIALLYLIFLWGAAARRGVAAAAAAVMLALLIAAPTIAPLVQFVKRTGYLETRGHPALVHAFPLHHCIMVVRP